MADFLPRLETFARQALPAVFAFFLILVSALPISGSAVHVMVPSLTIITVYYWSVNHVASMPLVLVLVIGILEDAIVNTPLGLHAVVLLAVYGVVEWQRQFIMGKAFLVSWFAFSTLALGSYLVMWIIYVIYSWSYVPVASFVVQGVGTAAIYPLFDRLFAFVLPVVRQE